MIPSNSMNAVSMQSLLQDGTQKVEANDIFLPQALPQLNEDDVKPFSDDKLEIFYYRRGIPAWDKVQKLSHYLADVDRNKLCFTDLEAKLIMDSTPRSTKTIKALCNIVNLHQNQVQQDALEGLVQDTLD